MFVYLLLPWFFNPLSTQVIVLATATAENPFVILANFGTLGVWVACTMTGLQPTRAELRRLDAEIARLVEDGKRRDAAVEALVSLMTNRTLPTLATAVAEMPTAAPSSAALGKLEALIARAEKVFGDERSS